MEPDRLNICMYTPTAYSGHARYTYELLSAMSEVGRDKGVRVSLVTSRDLASNYRTSLYPIHDILPPLPPRSTFRNMVHWGISRMTYYIRRERTFMRWVGEGNLCEVIHFQEYTPWLAPRMFRLLKAREKRLFFTVHQIYPQVYYPGIPKALYHSWVRTALRLCDALFVHTEGLQGQLEKFLGVGHPPVFVTPHVIRTTSAGDAGMAPSAEERVQHRRLLFFGVNRRKKGLDVLLRAMERLDDCTLTVAGPPQEPHYQEQIWRLVKQLPPGRVELIDRFVEDDEMARLFKQSSLIILPYTSFAGQSGVLTDTLAYRLPVVATDVGGLGETVRRWGIGQVVPPNDDVALAGAIREMLTPRRYAEVSGAVDRVGRDLSWNNRIAETTIEAYRSVGRGGSKATAP